MHLEEHFGHSGVAESSGMNCTSPVGASLYSKTSSNAANVSFWEAVKSNKIFFSDTGLMSHSIRDAVDTAGKDLKFFSEKKST